MAVRNKNVYRTDYLAMPTPRPKYNPYSIKSQIPFWAPVLVGAIALRVAWEILGWIWWVGEWVWGKAVG